MSPEAPKAAPMLQRSNGPLSCCREPRRAATSSLRAAGVLVGLFVTTASASAAPLDDELKRARDAIAAKDPDAALDAVDAARDAAEAATELSDPAPLGRIFFYEGLAYHLKGDTDKVTRAFRTSLVIDNEAVWDDELVEPGPALNLYEALRSEVRERPPVNAQVPELIGEARAFVDGGRVRYDEWVRSGQHLAQLKCPDDSVHGKWTTFEKNVKWLKMCPAGVDTSVVVTEAVVEEDEFGDFGPSFGADDGPKKEGSDRSPVVPGPSEGDLAKAPLVAHRVSWPLVAAGGGALAVSGVFYAVAAKRKAGFNDLSNPDIQSVADVEAAAKKVNAAGAIATSLGVVGGGLCVAAVIPW